MSGEKRLTLAALLFALLITHINPGELVNQEVKANAIGRRRPATQAEMMADARSYLRSTQRMPRIVRSYFNHPDVSYASA